MSTLAKPAILDRQAPIFGVCEAIGDDFGFNPNWLRAAMAPLVFWNPVVTLAGYLAVGLLVLATRLILPDVTAPAALPLAASPTAAEMPAEAQPGGLAMAA